MLPNEKKCQAQFQACLKTPKNKVVFSTHMLKKLVAPNLVHPKCICYMTSTEVFQVNISLCLFHMKKFYLHR